QTEILTEQAGCNPVSQRDTGNLPVTGICRRIIIKDDMQDDIGIGRVVGMAMPCPFGRGEMHFNISCPLCSGDADTSERKIRPGAAVPVAKVENFDRVSIGSLEVIEAELPCTPYVVEKIFSHGLIVVCDRRSGL